MRRHLAVGTRISVLETDMGEVKRELHDQSLSLADLKGSNAAAKIQIDAVNDKLDLLIEMQRARMERRNKIITALIGAIGTAIGAIVGVACT